MKTTPSPAGEQIPSISYYVPGNGNDNGLLNRSNGESIIAIQNDDEIADCPTGSYAGLDEELFYNAKYESIQHDGIYYSDGEFN